MGPIEGGCGEKAKKIPNCLYKSESIINISLCEQFSSTTERCNSMQMRMYSIRDSKAEIFNMPFYKHTHGEAERDFQRLVNSDDQSNIKSFPEDYDLYYIGLYDDQTGKIEPLDTPQHIVKAVQLVKALN